MIELSHVDKHYGHPGRGRTVVHALRAVSLHVERGSVCAVVGPNGAGKSTLLGIVLGFIRPAAGTAALAGAPPREYVRRCGAAYLPERFTLPGNWTVRDALLTFARLDRVPGPAGRSGAVMEQLDLAAVADRQVAELSRGTLQRLGLAQTLLARRDLIVLDEPETGLDPLWRVRLRDLIADWRADGSAVLLASHDLTQVERSADHVLLLADGASQRTLASHATAAVTRYRIRLAARAPLRDVFPDAEPDVRHGSAADALDYLVTVRDAADLSARLAALLALGGIVAAVVPHEEALEERVRAALEERGTAARDESA